MLHVEDEDGLAQLQNRLSEQLKSLHMKTMQLSHSKFHEAYKVARPYIQQAVTANEFDLILDIHRDSAKKEVTTLKTKQGQFAKM